MDFESSKFYSLIGEETIIIEILHHKFNSKSSKLKSVQGFQIQFFEFQNSTLDKNDGAETKLHFILRRAKGTEINSYINRG